MHGHGVMNWAEGLKVYTGQWKGGQITGYGEFFFFSRVLPHEKKL